MNKLISVSDFLHEKMVNYVNFDVKKVKKFSFLMSAILKLFRKNTGGYESPPHNRDRVKKHRQSTVLMFILELPVFYTSSHW